MNDFRMKDAYDLIAPQFAAKYWTMPEMLATLGEALLARLPERPRILDVGCGAGRDMAWLEAKGALVTGTDLSPGMLAEARTRVAGPLHEMDMRSLDFAESAFDAIWCNAALLHIPKTATPVVLEGFHRIVKPGGSLVLGLKRGSVEGWEGGVYEGVERYFSYFEEVELADLVVAAGFEVVSIETHVTVGPTWIHLVAEAV
ncbi:MAG: class I SAM-dependent methyltransferase [Thermomicrobiales bacterium]